MKKYVPYILIPLLMWGCGRASTKADVKMVGVGYNPDEIGPVPTPYGGLVEYNLLDFSGAGLSLGFAGLVSYSGIDEGMGFAPPFGLTYGFSYLFDAQLSGVDKVGTVFDPPVADDSCYTVLHPTGPLGSFNTADAGSNITFVGPEGFSFDVPRNPQEYPLDTQDVWTYYLSIAGYQAEPTYAYTLPEGAGNAPSDMQRVVSRPGNYPFGQEITMVFGGGVAPATAPISSIPRPSLSVSNPPKTTLPHREDGLLLSWNEWNDAKSVAEPHATCMNFLAPVATPALASDCVNPKTKRNDGQYYTAPWDTTDGNLKFAWTVPETESPGEYVSLSVRFLGPVDRERNDYLRTRMTNYADPGDLAAGRPSLSCENDPAYTGFVLDPQYYADWTPDDSVAPSETEPLIPALHGDPSVNVAEVTCRLKDDGEFVLSKQVLADAMKEANASGSEGAVFFFSRNTSADVEVPDAMDTYFQRRPITPVRLNTRVVKIGRFWNESATSAGEK
jgi:hypothetical protein